MIRVQAEDFDVGAELKALAIGPDVGAIASFVGVVRGGAVAAMTLEHYRGMTEKQLAAIEAEARARWPLGEVLIVHRYGRLAPGDNIVLCVATSAHRAAAFEACEFLVDWLKTKAPFWKREEDAAGRDAWVEARGEDDVAAERWQRDKHAAE
jgi:molybdopterin synthase catalytic subunit